MQEGWQCLQIPVRATEAAGIKNGSRHVLKLKARVSLGTFGA